MVCQAVSSEPRESVQDAEFQVSVRLIETEEAFKQNSLTTYIPIKS